MIHSSPFLRCVQTSVAISAGISQYQGSTNPTSHQQYSKPHIHHSGSPHLRAMDQWSSSHLSAIEESSPSRLKTAPYSPRRMSRTVLRVDAFLGEWLSPDYFANITHPPASKMMVAGAKAELLRGGEPIDKAQPSSQGNFPGGWKGNGSAISNSDQSDDETSLADLSSLSKNLPRLGRANSHNVGSSTKRSDPRFASRLERSPASQRAFYQPPTPSYAVSPSQPIPQGYVAHARDACLKVDYRWDSQRPPLEWGSGGTYGEEWSAMHKRFRHGLHDMISWYRNHTPTQRVESTSDESAEKRPASAGATYEVNDNDDDDDEEEDADVVLVLVTHGAGCNALIGALTNQPVLIDVGMASLTMAVRKTIGYKRLPSSEEIPISPRRRSMLDLGISEDYEVKLVSSTDHLRAGSQFLSSPQQIQRSPTLPVRDKSPYRYERPGFASSHNSPLHSPRLGNSEEDANSGSGSATPTKNSSGGLQKSATTAVQSSGGGLWTKPVPKKTDNGNDAEMKRPATQAGRSAPAQSFGLDGTSDSTSKGSQGRVNGDAKKENRLDPKPSNDAPDNGNQGHSIVYTGLWGAPPQPRATEREKGAKRRWTLSQTS